MALPQGVNQRWPLDFVSDTLTDSRRFRILMSLTTLPACAFAWLPTRRSHEPSHQRARYSRRLTRSATQHAFINSFIEMLREEILRETLLG